MKRPGGIGLLIVAVAATGLAAWAWMGGDADGSDSARVRREGFDVVVEATGTLEAAVAVEVGPPSAKDFWNYNLTWMTPEGSRVNQGDVIARFDATQLDDRLREHRAALETTLQEREKEERNLEISLRKLRLDLVKAEGELKKVDLDLSVPENLVSSIELEQNRLEQILTRRRVDFLKEKIEFERELVRSKLELLDVKRKFAEDKIAYNEEVKSKFDVKAPVSGMVVYVPKRNGDRWEVGESVWMLAKVLKVADVTTLQVEANVLEIDAARIAPGQPCEIAVDAVPGTVLRSQIAEIGQIVHERSLQDPSKVFDAILPLGQVDTDVLRPGMGVHVKIRTETQPDRLTIPIEAVRVASDGTYVEVRKRAGRAERRSVTLGPRDRRRVVVESGLEEGEEVLLTSRAGRS